MGKYTTRCFHFDGQGRPIKKGCLNSRCNFLHPGDPEWATSPGPRLSTHTSANTRYSSNRYGRDSSRSRSPRPSRARSRSYSPGRYRRNSASDSRMDSRAGPSEPYRGSRSSVASHSPAPPRQPPSSTMPPPPPVTAPPSLPAAVLPAPPPLPAAFTAPETPVAPKPREEMKVMWDSVLPLMADCVEARKAHQDALKDVDNFNRMLQTPRYTTLTTPEDKDRVDRQLAALKTACDEKAKGVTSALSLLKETNWWPVGPNQDEGAAEKYRELIQYAVQLNTTASEMYQEYVKKTHTAALPSGSTPETAVNVEPRESTSRPLKRRRVSNAADTAPPTLDPADVAELESLRDKLMDLEERVADIHNDILSLATQNEEDLVALIDERLESVSLEPRDRSGGANPSEVDQRVKKTNEDLDELGKAVALMMSDSEELHRQTEKLVEEKDRDLAELAAMRQQFQAYEEANKKDRDIMEALSAALDAYRQQPLAPAAIPVDFILAAINDPIRDTVRSVVQPMVDNLSKELEQKMVEQDGQLYRELWGKLVLTLKVVDAVSKVTPGRSPVPVS